MLLILKQELFWIKYIYHVKPFNLMIDAIVVEFLYKEILIIMSLTSLGLLSLQILTKIYSLV